MHEHHRKCMKNVKRESLIFNEHFLGNHRNREIHANNSRALGIKVLNSPPHLYLMPPLPHLATQLLLSPSSLLFLFLISTFIKYDFLGHLFLFVIFPWCRLEGALLTIQHTVSCSPLLPFWPGDTLHRPVFC